MKTVLGCVKVIGNVTMLSHYDFLLTVL